VTEAFRTERLLFRCMWNRKYCPFQSIWFFPCLSYRFH